MRRRGELIERSFAHNLETGGMRRTHLRMHDNILKRVLVHVAAFNLGIVMRSLFNVGKPRVLQGRAALAACIQAAFDELCAWLITSLSPDVPPLPPRTRLDRPTCGPLAPALAA